ncbi:phage/plasmid primase, P4 family [Cumulibacter soli]|uniref:phage/plasmid primase, P4 family n=1 Tax=Cumulibacter soli TaxID=2546344 RepID=UPI001068BE19|nr:phage/plasmid primase, P4 family [Cumulibacter soli]
MAHENLLNVSLAWHDAGACVLPAANDGSKRPAVSWKQYQSERPARDELARMLHDTDGIGVLCGHVSGNLEMIELEGRAVADSLGARLAQLLADNGFSDLWTRITSGYVEQTPSGGVHYLYRVDGEVRGNTKLARDCAGEATIETRGAGGWVVIAPSAGRTHPTGKPWRVLVGGPATVPVITEDERDALHAIAAMLDETPPREEPHQPAATGILAQIDEQPASIGGKRPGDDFNERATWDDILTPHGWQKAHRLGRGHAWTRPGKHVRDGTSATTNQAADGVDRFYVFSSSTDFDTETPYTKYAAYTLLNHGGDYKAAAKQLAKDGYGEQRRLAIVPTAPPLTETPTVSIETDGTSAKIVELSPTIDASTYGPTEDGVARALAHLHADDLRYCPQRGQWLTWSGSRWEWDERDLHREYIKALTRALPEGDSWASFKKRALSAIGVTGIARQARSDTRLAVNITTLDANPYELNTPAGIVDLRTGDLAPSDPSKLHTRSTAVAPDFDMAAPEFERFLDDTFGTHPELRGFVQRVLGLALVGRVLEQILIIAHGPGANGKSTLFEAAMYAIGKGIHGYAGSLPTSTLLAQRYEPHPTDIARLSGQRLTVASEIEDGQRFHEEKIKKLTGGDTISARFMRQDTFDFTPTHTLFLLANHLPSATAGGPAFWRRVVTVPFDHVVPVERRDPRLPEKLEAEAPAILAWIVRGAAAYFEKGLAIPADVREATEAYQRDQDTIGRFIEDQCNLVPRGVGSTDVSHLRERYERWCSTNGDTPVSARQLTQQLRDKHDVHSVKGAKGRRRYDGIVLPTYEDEEGE